MVNIKIIIALVFFLGVFMPTFGDKVDRKTLIKIVRHALDNAGFDISVTSRDTFKINAGDEKGIYQVRTLDGRFQDGKISREIIKKALEFNERDVLLKLKDGGIQIETDKGVEEMNGVNYLRFSAHVDMEIPYQKLSEDGNVVLEDVSYACRTKSTKKERRSCRGVNKRFVKNYGEIQAPLLDGAQTIRNKAAVDDISRMEAEEAEYIKASNEAKLQTKQAIIRGQQADIQTKQAIIRGQQADIQTKQFILSIQFYKESNREIEQIIKAAQNSN